MTTVNTNRKLLDLKNWEFVTNPPSSIAAGWAAIPSTTFEQNVFVLAGTTTHYMYNPSEDGWVQLPSGSLAGTFGAGFCGTCASVGPSGTASGGTTTTITTTQTLARNLAGYYVHITGGPNAGTTALIQSNTIGTNSTITVASAFGTAITSSSTWRLLTPRFFVVTGSSTTIGMKYYDYATNAWSAALSVTGFITTLGTDARFVATPSWMDTAYVTYSNGTTSSATTTTLVDSTKNWTASQWVNYQVRIVSGTGAGQIRTITASTSTSLTVATWTTTPDATSVYAIEGNDDYLYFTGNGSTAFYRYSISGNSWTTMTARGTAPSTGMSAEWIYGVPAVNWTTDTNIQNGRYIYCLRGGASSAMDRYDIPTNTWSNTLTYSPQTETFTTGTHTAYDGSDSLYIHKDATGRWFRFSLSNQAVEGVTIQQYPNGTAAVGNMAFMAHYIDGATTISFLYNVLNSTNVMQRMMII
jgi:hypothetical protein